MICAQFLVIIDRKLYIHENVIFYLCKVKNIIMRKFVLTLLFGLSAISSHSQKMVYVAEGYSQTSVNTTVFRNSSIVTFKDYQYIAFYDEEGYMVVGKRKLSSEKYCI